MRLGYREIVDDGDDDCVYHGEMIDNHIDSFSHEILEHQLGEEC